MEPAHAPAVALSQHTRATEACSRAALVVPAGCSLKRPRQRAHVRPSCDKAHCSEQRTTCATECCGGRCRHASVACQGSRTRSGRRHVSRLHAGLSLPHVLVLSCLVLWLGHLAPMVEGLVVSGSVEDVGKFMYIDKFCFDTTEQAVAYGVRAGTLSPDQGAFMRFVQFVAPIPLTVAVYNDGVDFDALLRRQDSLSCAELLQHAIFTQDLQSGGQRFEKVVWQESRPRFWFVAVAQCSSAATVTPGEKVPLNYELHYLNPGGTFQRQFSKDRQLEFEASIAALCIYVVLLVPMAYGAIFKSKSTALAQAFRVLTGCVAATCVSLSLLIAHAAIFADDGRGSSVLLHLGTAVDRAQNIVFMLLMVTMMKGWNTSYSELRTRVIVCNVVLAAALGICYTLVFAWELLFDAPANAFYLYESPPGVAIVILRLVVACWFVWSCYKRLTKTFMKRKKVFFAKFAVLGILYYLALPVVVVVAAVLEPWYRSKVVFILTLGVNTVAVMPIAYLLWPARMEDVFNTVETIAVRAKATVIADDPNKPLDLNVLDTPALAFDQGAESKAQPQPRRVQSSHSLAAPPTHSTPGSRRIMSGRTTAPMIGFGRAASTHAVAPSSRPSSSATATPTGSPRSNHMPLRVASSGSMGSTRLAPLPRANTVGSMQRLPPIGAGGGGNRGFASRGGLGARPLFSASPSTADAQSHAGGMSPRTRQSRGVSPATGPEDWPEVQLHDASATPYRRTLSRHVFNPV